MPELGSLLSGIATILVPLFLIVAVIAALVGVTRWRRVVGPNEALIVYGRGKPRVVVGGATTVLPVIENAQKMSLRIITIRVERDNVKTANSIELLLNWVAQVQIGSDPDSILTAARAFLGQTAGEIERVIQETLTGNFREVVATLTPEEVHQQKEEFAKRVLEFAAPEMKAMGLTIVALTVGEIADDVGYFQALGAPRIAEVKAAAKIAEADSARDSRVKTAHAELAAKEAEVAAAQRTAEAEHTLALKRAELKKAADDAKAQADVSYELKETELREGLVSRQGAVELQKQRQAALAAAEAVSVAQNTQKATVIVLAEAARQAAELQAEGEAKATTLKAGAEAEAERLKGQASADAIRATGEATAASTQAALMAQAEGEQKLAQARAAMDGVNLQLEIARMMFEAQVKIAAEYAGALAGIGANMKVVQFSGGSADGQQGNLLLQTLMQVPELAAVLNEKTLALAGADVPTIISRVVEMLKGAKVGTVVPEAKA